MIAGWVLITAGFGIGLIALVLGVEARRPDPRPPFTSPPQFGPPPEPPPGPLAPFPGLTRKATPGERDWWLTEQDDGGPLYSWQTGEFQAVIEDGDA